MQNIIIQRMFKKIKPLEIIITGGIQSTQSEKNINAAFIQTLFFRRDMSFFKFKASSPNPIPRKSPAKYKKSRALLKFVKGILRRCYGIIEYS
ncbi:MAG: hypothetical protein LBV52_04160 [Spirochaetaceae bacterium]|nr:hypothetical protein [Spirochaetaceae bacterium]